MKRQTSRIFTLVLTVALAAALSILKQNAVRALAAPPPTVAAADIQRWRVTNGFYALNVFGDGTILAASDAFVNGPGSGVKLSPITGTTIAPFFGPDVRTSIRLGVGSEQDWVVGGYENRPACRQDGSFATDLFPAMGCCNIVRYPLALDHVNDKAYLHANQAKGGVVMATSTFAGWDYDGVDFAGMISISDPNTLYSAGQGGHVVRWPASGVNLWSVAIDSTYLQPGAVTTDGSFVVTSGAPHLSSLPNVPGRLARVMSNGNVLWNHAVNAVTPPVIGSNGLIFVGTQPAPINTSGPGAIEAYDPATGGLVWSVTVDGLPNDLLVGDDGAVYAGTGRFASGTVYAIGQSDGAVRQIITDVPGAWEIILRAGLLYASGTSITALPVAANNYDPNSPWPVRFHDNQRTGNRTAPILNPSRIPPAPTPVPTPTPGPLCGGPPSYTSGPNIPTPGRFQTGVALGDFNEDGNQDILFSNVTTNNVSLRLGDGQGGFSGSANFSAPDHPWRIVTADFNNDGHLDYAVAGNNDGLSQVRLGDGNGGFDNGTDYQMTWQAAFITTADFNGDGNADLATSSGGFPPNGIQVAVRLGNGSGGFGPIISVPAGTALSTIVSADFNGDGRPDLAVAAFNGNKVVLRLNDGNGGFVNGADVPVGNGAREIGIGDFNGDGKKDLAVTNELSNTISILIGDGLGGFSPLTQLPTGSHPYALVVSDFDNDGDDDILQSDTFTKSIRVHLGDGLGGFTALPDLIGDVGTNVFAVDDFNNDGIKDFASANNSGSADRVRVWIGNCALADSVAPLTITNTSVLPNGAGWNNTNVDVVLTAEDNEGGSGVKDITYSASGAQSIASTTVNGATAGFTISAEGETTITYNASDIAGNHEPAKTIIIKIDKTAPTISVVSPTAGNYLLNQAVTVNFSCTDNLSGVESCTGSSPNGSILDTTSIGAKSFTVTAIDLAGNAAVPAVVNYTVGYGIVALYDQTKAHKSGSTIPIKIKLVDASGTNVSSPSTVVHAVSVIQISSQASTNFGDSGNANPDFDFRYDASLGGYIFNLQTTGFGTGSYLLRFVAGNSPTIYSVGFQVRQ
jgi:hypothetical protein